LQEANQKCVDDAVATAVTDETQTESLLMKEEESPQPPCEHEQDLDDASVTGASCVVVKSAVADDVQSVESENLNENKNIAINESWEVLNHDGHHLDSEVALAAQVLGSTLFLSNMSVNSQISTDTTTFNLSSSNVTDVTPGLLSRWEKELHKLHELGFVDDHLNIDALETLEAANIGVESVDPVTVEQAVNYLIKKSASAS
jgi:hypothetical protein